MLAVASALSNRQRRTCARKHDEDGHTAPGVYGRGSIPLSHSGLTGINLISKTIAPPMYKL